MKARFNHFSIYHISVLLCRYRVSALVIMFCFYSITFWAQAPLPCGVVAQMQPFCGEACIICDIDGFTGINDSPIGGNAPDDFCTTQENNVQWIAFIAGSVDLTLEVEVGDCTGGSNSLEVGIYQGIDCDNFLKVSNCDTDIPENTTETFTTFVPLVIGQYYFFVMDGSWGTVCDYTINVIEGSTNVAQLGPSTPFDIPEPLCVGKPFLLESYPQVGATIYEWTIDGLVVNQAPNLNYTYLTAGNYEVCYQESNACDAAAPICQTITVQDETQLIASRTLCEGDTLLFYDQLYTQPGIYENIVVPGVQVCDTIFTLEIEPTAPEIEEVAVVICNEDVFVMNEITYDQTGLYEQYLFTTANCDSTIILDLLQIECNISGETMPEPLLCYGDANSGSVEFVVDVGTPPFTYMYEEVFDSNITGTGTIDALGIATSIQDLPKGQYIINIDDNFGNKSVLQFTIEEPTLLQSEMFSDENYSGYDVSCIDAEDGVISLAAEGGSPTYQYYWSTGEENITSITMLPAGIYSLTVVDLNGCESVSDIELSAPPPLEVLALTTDPDCGGIATGSILLSSIKGGVAPYNARIDEGEILSTTEFSDLTAGTYSIEVQDANGCSEELSVTLSAALIPEIDLDSLVTINLGDLVNLIPEIDLDGIANYSWIVNPDLSCITCIESTATPLYSTSYTFTATSEDGCQEEKTVLIRVLKNRDLYAPNTMNLSAVNQENRYFTIFGSNQVLEIGQLRIYDRWGNQVFSKTNFPANKSTEGWNGMYKQRSAMEGVYSWVAELVFLDEETKQVNGSFTLIR